MLEIVIKLNLMGLREGLFPSLSRGERIVTVITNGFHGSRDTLRVRTNTSIRDQNELLGAQHNSSATRF